MDELEDDPLFVEEPLPLFFVVLVSLVPLLELLDEPLSVLFDEPLSVFLDEPLSVFLDEPLS
ncbi:MAG: hypothetical protein CMQ20_14280, partial [Gammaproteobacteria bacterium]|nr:hypothetical protein [Gammaproteobacteria bacterium]